jgi:SAM-dependent methyltransferase
MQEGVSLATGSEAEELVRQVRERYARIADGKEQGCCGPQASGCGCSQPEAAAAEGIGYSKDDLAQVPAEANLGLGCGAPLTFLALAPGETVLDLGSGPGLDAFLAARQVGPTGRVIGVDMTPSMLERARVGAAKMGLAWVEFREGRLEALPVEAASVDAVTSNCVINLVPDKAAVFAEVARVLRPGGRLVVSDIILDAPLPSSVAHDVLSYVGCISGAVLRGDYFGLLEKAGLAPVEVLRDFDALTALVSSGPEELSAFRERTGVDPRELSGKVRSVTFRVTKPADTFFTSAVPR